jgi:hypothetical protein
MLIAEMFALHLISLHTPEGNDILVNPSEIISIRSRREEETHFAGDVHCLLFTADGKFIGVRETCDEVRTLFNKAQQETE